MVGNLHHSKLFDPLRSFLILVMITGLWGCSAWGPPQDQPEWSCDDAADAAVEREDWRDAMVRHQAFVKQVPDNCLALYHLGYIYGKLDYRVEEAAHYEKAVACGLDTDDLLFYNLGMAYGDMNLMDEALAAFERAIHLNPDNAENYFGLGLIAQAAGQGGKARSALEKAVELDPRHWEAHIILTRIYLNLGQLNSARLHLERLRKNIPENEEVVELWQTYEDRSITTYDPSEK